MKAVKIVSWMLIFVAIGATAASWIPSLDIDQDDAERVALGAMRAGGYEDATVSRPIVFDDAGRAPVADDADDADDEVSGATQAVWIVPVSVEGETIEFRIDKRGQLLFVDDLVGEDQQDRFFSDDEWDEVRHYDAGILADWIWRNVAGSIAAVFIVAAGFVIAKRTDLVTKGVAPLAAEPPAAASPPARVRARARLSSTTSGE